MPNENHRSTSRVLDIFDLLSTSIEGLTLTEISSVLDAPKSSILPMLQTMTARGFLEMGYNENRYTIGPKMAFDSMIYRNRIHPTQFIDMEMKELTKTYNVSCYLSIMDGKDAVIIYRVDPKGPVAHSKQCGDRELGVLSAAGKSLLCDHRLAELTDLYINKDSALPASVNIYLTHVEMERSRVTGLNYENGTIEPGVQCVAGQIRHNSKIVAALSVILLDYQITPSLVLDINTVLLTKIRKIENILDNCSETPEEIFRPSSFPRF